MHEFSNFHATFLRLGFVMEIKSNFQMTVRSGQDSNCFAFARILGFKFSKVSSDRRVIYWARVVRNAVLLHRNEQICSRRRRKCSITLPLQQQKFHWELQHIDVSPNFVPIFQSYSYVSGLTHLLCVTVM